MDKRALEALFDRHGCADFVWADPGTFVIADWVRMKCRFGCGGYGRYATCPPNVPDVAECRRFFANYSTAAIFHFQRGFEVVEERYAWQREIDERLIGLERDVFLAGYVKAFVLFASRCRFCEECPSTLAECRRPEQSRPSPEGLAMDVFSTVRHYELPIEVLSDYGEPMNRYGFLLVE